MVKAAKKLYRSEKEKVIAGVAGGLADFFGLDPTLIRIFFVLITFFGGSGILLYIILWLLIPDEKNKGVASSETIKDGISEIKSHLSKTGDQGRFFWGVLLVLMGAVFLLSNFGFFRIFNFQRLWPLMLIALGFLALFKK